MNTPEEIQVPVQFLTDHEFEAKDWPEYGVTITQDYSEEDFQREFCAIIEQMERALLLEGWTRGLIKPHDDYDIAVDYPRPHRSLDISIISNRILRPHLLALLTGFLRQQPNRWMLHIADERWTPESGYKVDFKLVVEPDMIWIAVENDDILPMLGIEA